jgi:signal transduction histidine kinase
VEASGREIRRLRRVAGALLLPVALVGGVGLVVEGLLHAGRLDRPAPQLALRSALFEPEASEPAAVTLPHDWRATHPAARRARYLLRGPGLAAPAGLYLPSAPMDLEVLVNGQRAYRSDRFSSLPTRYWHVPLYVAVPDPLLRLGGNDIELRVGVDRPGDGYLSPVWFGPDAALRPAYELRELLQVSAVQVLVVAMLSFAAFMALLWLRRRRETAYFWFALVLLVYAFGFFNLVTLRAWLPKPSWSFVGLVNMAWLTVASAIFTHRLLGRRHPRLELGFAGGALAGTLFFWGVRGTALYEAARPFWGLLVLAAGLWPAFLVSRTFLRSPTPDLQLVMAAGLLLIASGAHDVGMVNGALSLEHDFTVQWAALGGMALFAWIFASRFVTALDTSEALTGELEARVAHKSAELESNYQQLRRLEHDRLLARERERITAEIHDGLGGQLVSTLALVRSGEARPAELEQALQDALDDMRLMIHSLDQGEGDLLTLLATLRGRLGPRLERGGIRVDWRVEDVPAPAGFGPERALQVLRIVQEAITNVVKHSGAETLRVRTGTAGGRVFVLLEDDGRGMPDGAGRAGGRGLGNMRRRAEQLGATLEVRSSSEGTQVRLELALAG